MIIEVIVPLIYCSILMTIASFISYEQPLSNGKFARRYFTPPILPFICGLFWLSLVYIISSVEMYLPLSASVDLVTYLPRPGILYLFGGLGIIMLLHGIYCFTMKDMVGSIEELSSGRGVI